MKISTINCPVLGEILIESKRIDELFSTHRNAYKTAFNLTKTSFNQMVEFKKKRGGVVIEIKNQNKNIGFFTLTFGEDKFLELGDLMKLNRDFPRESFARAMKEACIFIIKHYQQKGVYIYPNPYAVNLEKMAGFKEHSLYVKHISFVFFNLIFLLPIIIYGRKIHFFWGFFSQPIVRRNMNITPTRLRKYNFIIFKKSPNLKIDTNNNFGLLYEFVPSKNHGDPFLIFGQDSFDPAKIGFEFCDNSA